MNDSSLCLRALIFLSLSSSCFAIIEFKNVYFRKNVYWMKMFIHIDNKFKCLSFWWISFDLNITFCWIYKFDRNSSLSIDFLSQMQESKITRSRERSQNAENKKSLKNATKNYIDMKMKKVIVKKQAFNNSTLRQFSQF